MTTMTRTTRKGPWAAVVTALLTVTAVVLGSLVFSVGAVADAASTDCTDRGYDFVAEVQVGGEQHEYTWTYGQSIDAAVVKAANAYKVYTYTDGATSGTVDTDGMLNEGGQEPAISHISLCRDRSEPPPPDHDASARITCLDGWAISLTGYTDMVGAPVVVKVDDVAVPGARVIDANGAFTDSGPTDFADHNQHTLTVLVDDELVASDKTPMCQGGEAAATLTCTAGWTVDLIGYIPNRDVEVFLDGASVAQGSITPSDRTFAASGPTSFTSGLHNLSVTVDKVEGPVATVGPIDCTPTSDGGGGTPQVTPQVFTATQPYCAVADAAAGTYTTATLTATGDSQVTADAALKTQATALTTGIVPAFGVGNNEFTGLNWTADGPATFANGCVTPTAQIVAPVEAATVPVTEAPEAVAVPAPATVPVPAAVPAGDGSTVPQVPVALLALLALATAAAVTSGLRMATNR